MKYDLYGDSHFEFPLSGRPEAEPDTESASESGLSPEWLYGQPHKFLKWWVSNIFILVKPSFKDLLSLTNLDLLSSPFDLL